MKCNTVSDLEQFLKIQEQALGAKCPEVATTISKIANMYLKEGRYDEAEAYHRKALEIRETLNGPHRLETVDSQRCLDEVLKFKAENINTMEAFRISHKGIKPLNESGNESETEPVQTTDQEYKIDQKYKKIQWSSAAQSNNRQDISEVENELNLLRRMVGANDIAVADCLTKLADLYYRNNMPDRIETVLVEALKIREMHMGHDHTSVATEIKNLARLYYFQQRYTLAEPLFKRALAIREKAFGKLHPKVADIAEWYGKVLRKTNRIAQAEEMEIKAAQIKDKQSLPSVG